MTRTGSSEFRHHQKLRTAATCPDREAFFGRPLPRILVRHHTTESRARREVGAALTIGLFNWTDTVQMIGVAPAQLGLEAGA